MAIPDDVWKEAIDKAADDILKRKDDRDRNDGNQPKDGQK